MWEGMKKYLQLVKYVGQIFHLGSRTPSFINSWANVLKNGPGNVWWVQFSRRSPEGAPDRFLQNCKVSYSSKDRLSQRWFQHFEVLLATGQRRRPIASARECELEDGWVSAHVESENLKLVFSCGFLLLSKKALLPFQPASKGSLQCQRTMTIPGKV